MATTVQRLRYAPLAREEVDEALKALPAWRGGADRLVRAVRTDDPWPLLEQVVRLEEELDHHTVVTLEAGALVFTVWTHVTGGVTAADLQLASRLEELVERCTGED